ncbi:hypothetical protein GCM10012275_31090 [Longimycelium tulufanense]|uniref:Sortilin N-terminal domain-containing protein n=1 Tax=Longimycelium tulufanense TaxID=907463 RepID=A0A8J3C8U2_9PSEU|nr:sialidase family protein [Longimycelium tulufanense]GGM57663.1 hypothetical protein GCM10012275_31090 [Longimycelium tulufanense]
MRRSSRFIASLTALATVLLTPPAHAEGPPGTGQPGEYRPVKGPSAPAEHRYLQKAVRGETLPRHAYADAARQARQLPRLGGQWQSIGPTNIGGRIVDLALDPHREDVLYAAAASGGLWRSTDAGRTFHSVWPDDATQAMGAVATGSDGTLWVGTGEPNPGGGSVTYEGTGVYRSRDGGATWQPVGLRDSGAIGAVRVDPRDPQRVLVAATGSLYNGGGDRGVYLTTDAGETWRRVLAVPNEFTGAADVQLDPTDPDRIYAVLWDHRRTPTARTYGGVGSSVHRSTDGGQTWQRLSGGLPSGANVGRIGLGIAASEPGRLYAIVVDATGYFDRFLTSTDAGITWTALPASARLKDSQSSYGWWFGKVWVNPDNARHVHVAGVPLVTSKDGGRSWRSDGSGIHVDHHAMVWDPRYPSRVYLGNDGGVYRSDRDGDGGWVKAVHEPYTQLYSAAITPQDASRVSGGSQDNGSLRSWGGARFNEYLGGDGEENLINPKDRNNVFACYQYGNCFRSTNGGNSLTFFTPQTISDRRNWFTPMAFDPVNPRILYYAGNRLNRSTNGGVSWTAISPDLTGGPGQDDYPYGTITTIAPASDGRTIWVGTDDGRVWVTRDLGRTWSKVLENQPWVTRVVVDERSPERAWVTLSGYRSGSKQPHLLATADGGRTWRDISGNLPNAPVNDVVVGKNNTLYVATDQGVFTTPVGFGLWLQLGSGLPASPVDDIEYDPTNHRLVAATFGRGFYELRVS